MDNPSRIIADRLAWELSSWSSIELTTRQELSDPSANNRHGRPYKVAFDEHYIETPSGKRYAKLINRDPDGGEQLYASYSDGTRFVDVTHRGGEGSPQLQYVIKRSFGTEGGHMASHRPIPLKYAFLEQIPLHERLAEAFYLGTDKVLGRDCHIFSFSGVKWNFSEVELIYKLDNETGLPLEVRCYSSTTDRENDWPSWTWEARSFDRMGNYHIPANSVEILYFRSGVDQQPKKHTTRVISVEECSYNQSYEDSIFQPAIHPGVMVWDTINEKQWLEPELKSQPLSESDNTSTGEFVRADVPRDWTTPLSYGGIGLGIILLAVTLVIWRRH